MRVRALVCVLALGMLSAACGGTASSPPAATPTPTPQPTPTPFDIGAAFLAIVGDDGLDGRIEMTGTMELGITAEISGSIDSADGNSRMEFTTTFGSNTTTVETVSVDDVVYTRTTGGPWLLSDSTGGSSGGTDFSDWLRSLKSVEDLGVVTKNGQALHHLKPDKPVPDTAFLGASADQAKNPSFTIEMYAEDDGTPALFTIEGTWTQPVNGQDINVEMAMDMTFTRLGAGATVRAPTDVWTSYDSPLGYTMAHPEAFTVANRDGYDAYLKGSDEWFYVTLWPEAKGLSADGYRDYVIESYTPDYGQPAIAPSQTVLAGEPGWAVAWQYTLENGDSIIVHDVLAMHADVGWEVTLVTFPEVEGDDLELLNMAIKTFSYGS